MEGSEGLHGFPLQLVAPGDWRQLAYEGSLKPDGRWADGYLHTADRSRRFPVIGAIPRFAQDDERDRLCVEGLREAVASDGIELDDLIDRNWRNALRRDNSRFANGFRRILESEGPILEVATGPGGGMAPMLLGLKREAEIVMNDIRPWCLSEWQRLALREGMWPNLSFAQFDACEMPIGSQTVGCVTSLGGISNVEPSSEPALAEILRVLRPGGLFYAEESMVELLPSSNSPEDIHESFAAVFQRVTDYGEALRDLGFADVRAASSFSRDAIPGEGGAVDWAEERGAAVRFHDVILEARAP